jgi:hypothetical protein
VLRYTTSTLQEMDIALAAFHRYCQIFEDINICSDSFGMPQQLSFVHYTSNICLFGVLTGLNSAITKSKHIKAVKEPWRELNRVHTINQMITKNSWLSQMAALQAEFARLACVDDDNKINGPDDKFSMDGYVRVSVMINRLDCHLLWTFTCLLHLGLMISMYCGARFLSPDLSPDCNS